jgi:hypothetical protein
LNERKSVAIWWHEVDLMGNFRWALEYKLTWSEYLEYSKSVSGEGNKWKAVII